mgnify:CR=1 FL=1
MTPDEIHEANKQVIELALLRGALARIVRLEEREADDPLGEAVRIARSALLATN